mgnify:CR=1 FL=1
MENKDLCTREYTLLFNGLTDVIAELEEMLLRIKRRRKSSLWKKRNNPIPESVFMDCAMKALFSGKIPIPSCKMELNILK